MAGINWGAILNAVKTVTTNPAPEEIPGIAPTPEDSKGSDNADHHPEVIEETSTGQDDIKEVTEDPDDNADDAMDDLSIEELISLFQNFKQLDEGTRTHLMDYMKRLEKTNPAKVTEFKKQLHSAKK